MLVAPQLAFAQAVDGGAVRQQRAAALAKADAELRDISRAAAKTDDDDALSDLRARAIRVQGDADEFTAQLAARLEAVDANLAQLGPPPNPPSLEPPEVREARARLQGARATVDGFSRQSRLISTRAGQAAERIVERRRTLFNTRLFTRGPSPFSAQLWSNIGDNLPRDLSRLRRLGTDASATARRRADLPSLGALVGALLAAILLIGPARLWLEGLGRRYAARRAPSGDLARSSFALWRLTIGTLLPALAAGALQLGLNASRLLSESAAEIAGAAVWLIAWIAFVTALGRAFLSADLSAWRLAPLSDSLARRLRAYPWLVATATAGGALLERINSAIGASLAATVAANCAISLLYAATAGLGLWIIGRARLRELDTGERHTLEESSAVGSPLRALITVGVLLAVAASFAAALLGYFAFAYLIARQILWIGILAAFLYMLLRFVDDAFTALFSSGSRIGDQMRATLSLKPSTVEQLGVVGSALTRVMLLLAALGVVLAPFGAGAGAVLGRFGSVATGFKIGGLTLSPLGLATGVFSFLLGLWIVRAVQRWLNDRYLPKTDWDTGVRASVSTAVGYLGVIVAGAWAAAAMGLALQQIALIASALSVGIGFGLQAIVSNFISGLILLVERPVKVGDWVAVGDQEGDIRRINVRATEIAMFDRSTLIVPNSEFVTKTVRNITHGGNLGRASLRLTLAQGADVERARALFLDAARAVDAVLADPAPLVLIDAVTDAGVVMVSHNYVASPRAVAPTRSELYFEVLGGLKAAGIGLAKSGTEVTVNLPPPSAHPGEGRDPSLSEAASPPASAAPARQPEPPGDGPRLSPG